MTKVKGYEVNRMVAATLVFEGSAAVVKRKENLVYSIAKKYGGMAAGEVYARVCVLVCLCVCVCALSMCMCMLVCVCVCVMHVM